MYCPKDGTTLGRRIYESDIEINECPQCGGIWLDHGELEQIQSTIENDYSDKIQKEVNRGAQAFHMKKQLEEDRLTCPNCDEIMSKKEHGFTSQVIIDYCPYCRGIWLDKGELEALEVFFERERANASTLSKTTLLWYGIKDFFSRGK